MVMFVNDLGDLNPQNTPISTFYIAFHRIVVSEHRDFKFGTQVVAITSLWDEELSLLKQKAIKSFSLWSAAVCLMILCGDEL